MQAEYLLEYQFTETTPQLPLAGFVVCLHIMDVASTQLIVDRTCTTQIHSSIKLRNLPIGQYHIHSYLKKKASSNGREDAVILEDGDTDEIVLNVNVMQLDQISAPQIMMGSIASEFVTDISTGVVDIAVPYHVMGLTTIVQQLQMCIVLLDQQHRNEVVIRYSSSCLPSTYSELTLLSIKPGLYMMTLFLAVIDPDSGEPTMQYPSSKVSVPVTVQLPSEFVPSYDWKPLHPWHTIPSGIETRYVLLLLRRETTTTPHFLATGVTLS